MLSIKSVKSNKILSANTDNINNRELIRENNDNKHDERFKTIKEHQQINEPKTKVLKSIPLTSQFNEQISKSNSIIKLKNNQLQSNINNNNFNLHIDIDDITKKENINDIN